MDDQHLEALWRLAPETTRTITYIHPVRTEKRTMVLPTTEPEALAQTLMTMATVPIEVTVDPTNQAVRVAWTRVTKTETTDAGTTTTSRTTTRDGAESHPSPVQQSGPHPPQHPLRPYQERYQHLVRQSHPENLPLDPAQRTALARVPQLHRDLLLGLAALLEAPPNQRDQMMMSGPTEPNKRDLPDFPSPEPE
jgi:hypothetical protein